MSTDRGSGEGDTLATEEAFAVLGDETRLQILETLGRADGPLAFSELFERIDYRDSSNFGYHLDRLVGHFVDKTDRGYELRQSGRRVVEAIQSGAVTGEPAIEPTRVDRPCPFCSARIEVAVRQEHVELHCPECPGMFGEPDDRPVDDHGNLGHILLPPAGVRDRTPAQALEAAEVWTATEMQSTARGVCPRCAAAVEHAVDACADHERSDGRCDACGNRFGALVASNCTNCLFEVQAPLAVLLSVHRDLMAFMLEQDVDPVSTEAFLFIGALEETIHSTDPFGASLTFAAEEDITVTVDDDLSVVDVERRGAGESTE